MDLGDTISLMLPPIRVWENGAVRIADTRIGLDIIVYAFNQGQAPEAIAHSYPSLRLADVYCVIAYYLNNRETVDQWIAQRDREADEFRREWEKANPPAVTREMLLARLAEREAVKA
jgi:uncharacterized protein (DUF433 family)